MGAHSYWRQPRLTEEFVVSAPPSQATATRPPLRQAAPWRQSSSPQHRTSSQPLGRRRSGDGLAVDMDAVRDLEHMGHVVGDQDDRRAALLHVNNEFEHTAQFLDAERRRRFVHDNDALGEGGGPSNRDPLPLASRQSLDRLIDVLNRHQPEFVELLARELLHLHPIECAKGLWCK